MPTTKERINVTLTADMRDAIEQMSKRDRIPRATVASALIREGLEFIEDEYWARLALKRDRKDAKFISHEEAWKHLSK